MQQLYLTLNYIAFKVPSDSVVLVLQETTIMR